MEERINKPSCPPLPRSLDIDPEVLYRFGSASLPPGVSLFLSTHTPSLPELQVRNY